VPLVYTIIARRSSATAGRWALFGAERTGRREEAGSRRPGEGLELRRRCFVAHHDRGAGIPDHIFELGRGM
jgi:hypothetical protein